MQVGVLKNRLLQASGGDFDEAAYGFSAFRAVVDSLGRILRAVPNTRPLKVELNDDGVRRVLALSPDATPVYVGQRIREDLWRAVMDYSSSEPYHWDSSLRRAVRAELAISSGLAMPTISKEVLRGWKDVFVTAAAPRPATDASADLTGWLDGHRPTTSLPRQLQQEWNAALKNHVLVVLREWAERNAIDLPNPLVPPEERVPSSGNQALRLFVHRCVDAMTDSELLALSIPAAVALRVHR